MVLSHRRAACFALVEEDSDLFVVSNSISIAGVAVVWDFWRSLITKIGCESWRSRGVVVWCHSESEKRMSLRVKLSCLLSLLSRVYLWKDSSCALAALEVATHSICRVIWRGRVCLAVFGLTVLCQHFNSWRYSRNFSQPGCRSSWAKIWSTESKCKICKKVRN